MSSNIFVSYLIYVNILNLKLRVCSRRMFIYELDWPWICQVKQESDCDSKNYPEVFVQKNCDDFKESYFKFCNLTSTLSSYFSVSFKSLHVYSQAMNRKNKETEIKENRTFPSAVSQKSESSSFT